MFTPDKNNLSFFKKSNYAQQRRSHYSVSVDIDRYYTALFGSVKKVFIFYNFIIHLDFKPVHMRITENHFYFSDDLS